ncbi:hypothetical protein BVRB_038780, partial [Beta vulgaris subsp. vulgaris]
CANSVVCLGDSYCPIAHAEHFPQVDNPMDAMIMDLIPRQDRQAAVLQQADRCPYQPRRKRRRGQQGQEGPPQAVLVPRRSQTDRFRPWRDELWQQRAAGIACAISELRMMCCPPERNAPRADRVRSTSSTPSDRVSGGDHGVLSQAFPLPVSGVAEVFTAGNRRVSPPVRPPAR